MKELQIICDKNNLFSAKTCPGFDRIVVMFDRIFRMFDRIFEFLSAWDTVNEPDRPQNKLSVQFFGLVISQ